MGNPDLLANMAEFGVMAFAFGQAPRPVLQPSTTVKPIDTEE